MSGSFASPTGSGVDEPAASLSGTGGSVGCGVGSAVGSADAVGSRLEAEGTAYALPDGSDEATFGDACDGADSDQCDEGTIACNGTALYCTDTTGDILDVPHTAATRFRQWFAQNVQIGPFGVQGVYDPVAERRAKILRDGDDGCGAGGRTPPRAQ